MQGKLYLKFDFSCQVLDDPSEDNLYLGMYHKHLYLIFIYYCTYIYCYVGTLMKCTYFKLLKFHQNAD